MRIDLLPESAFHFGKFTDERNDLAAFAALCNYNYPTVFSINKTKNHPLS